MAKKTNTEQRAVDRSHARTRVWVSMRVDAILTEAAVVAAQLGLSPSEFVARADLALRTATRELEYRTDKEIERLEAAQFAVASSGENDSKGEPT